MSFTIAQGHPNRMIYRIFDLYLAAGVGTDAPYKVLRNAVKNTLRELSPEDKDYIKNVSFELHPNMFVIKDEPVGLFDLFVGFSNFCKVLYGMITRYKSEYVDMKPVVRKKLPDLKAFEFIGNNDLNISYAPSNYTLVYGA